MVFEEIEVGIWKPETPGDLIQGILLNVQNNIGANNSNLYTLEVDMKPISVWGSAILDPKMTAAQIGDSIQIVYDGLGDAKSGQSAPKLFKVFIDYDFRESKQS